MYLAFPEEAHVLENTDGQRYHEAGNSSNNA